MYVQINEKRELAGRHMGREEKDMRVVANFSWLCLHNIFLSQEPSLAMDCGQSQFSPSLCTDYKAIPFKPIQDTQTEAWGWIRLPQLWVLKPWLSQLCAENILMLALGSFSRDTQVKSHPSLWDYLLVLRPSSGVLGDRSTSPLPFLFYTFKQYDYQVFPWMMCQRIRTPVHTGKSTLWALNGHANHGRDWDWRLYFYRQYFWRFF